MSPRSRAAGGSQTFQVNLAGPDLNKLAEYADQLIAELKKQQGIRRPRHDALAAQARGAGARRPRGGQRPGRAGAAPIADTLRVLVGGLPVSKFRDGDEQYDVWLRAEARDRGTAQDLYQLTLPSPTVGLVKLASLAKLVDERGPTEIERLGRERDRHRAGQPRGHPAGRGGHPRGEDPARR